MSGRFTRRSLLNSAAIVAAGASAGLLTPFPLEAKKIAASHSFRLGLASYTFRNFPRASVIQMMGTLQLRELNAKDVKDHLPADPNEEKQALDAYAASGIHLHAAGTISLASDDEAALRSRFEYCKRAGVDVMVGGDPTPKNLPVIEKLVQEYNIRVAIHNHGPEDKMWHAPSDILRAVGSLDHRLGCCIDVGHTARAGEDVVAAIRSAGPRLFNLHMKDLTSFDSKESQVPVGQGKMPVKEIFATLDAIHYPGFVDLEYEVHPDDPMPGVTASFETMRRLLE